jgi:glycyl-tRNA synthetase beta chain
VVKNSELPSSIFSSIVAMSNKIDNLMDLFSAGKIPTGSKDPFALEEQL